MVLNDDQEILKRTLNTFSWIKEELLGCLDKTEVSMHVIHEPIWHALQRIKTNGVRIKIITEVTPENVSFIKKLMNITEVRHLDGIRSNFGVADRKECLLHTVSRKNQPLSHAIISNVRGIVDAQIYLFEALWKKGVDAREIVMEIEEGIAHEFIETIKDGNEIQKVIYNHIYNAKQEILLLLPTVINFQSHNSDILEILRKSKEQNRNINLKVLVPLDYKHTNINTDGFEIRYYENEINTKASLLIIDRQYSLINEITEGCLPYNYSDIPEFGTCIYSNNKSIVLSYVSFFESLWILNEFYEKIKTTERIQKEFINIAAHELKSPIQPILGVSGLLRDGKIRENQKEFVDVIYRNAKRLQKLTEEILDVTKIESNSLSIYKEKFCLDGVVLNIVKDFKKYIEDSKKIRFEYDNHNSNLIVYADKNRIIQVISNLIDNSIKFIQNEGIISVSLEKIDDGYDKMVIVSVKDAGSGIDKDIMPRLFEKFATKSFQGTGLGLFISKGIIEAHDGKIWAENNKDGKGATFSFTLPINN